MINQNLFIFEFVSGGGYNRRDIPSSLFCEGYAMLRTIVEDFKKLGFKITTLLDRRISHLSRYLISDIVKFVNPKEDFLKKYIDCVSKSTYCFIIAPEFSNHLYNLTQIVKEYKKKILSIDLNGVWLGTSKLETYKYFTTNKLNTPKSYLIPFKEGLIDVDFIFQKFDQLGSSIIIKPEDGAGSELIFHFETKDQILQFFKRSEEKLDMVRNYIVQEYIEGDDLSISLINRTNLKKTGAQDQIILSINTQDVQNLTPNKESLYLGGFTPVENYGVLRDRFEKILKSMNLTKFQGYFGIDFIKKADNSIYFIEINPRLTTSYIGIRNILDYNPLELLLNQYKSKLEIPKSRPDKFSHFTRLELKYFGNKLFENIINDIIPKLIKLVPEIVTPPIALQSSKINKELIYSCFISTKAKDMKSSKKRISQILTIFNKFSFEVIK
ncbi:MAG: ATP-grasp domain-containing protein [Candidatus Lokiarchaeota archaeon]|nr:ATP-grasp domain-containing protein [Candidatus Lokiarchaeota archaeon]